MTLAEYVTALRRDAAAKVEDVPADFEGTLWMFRGYMMACDDVLSYLEAERRLTELFEDLRISPDTNTNNQVTTTHESEQSCPPNQHLRSLRAPTAPSSGTSSTSPSS